MTELQKILKANESFGSSMIQDLLILAQQSSGASSPTTGASPLPTSADVNLNPVITQSGSRLLETTSSLRNLNLDGGNSFPSGSEDNNGNQDNDNNPTNSSVETQLDTATKSTGRNTNLTAGQTRQEAGRTQGVLDLDSSTIIFVSSEIRENPSESRLALVEQVTTAIVAAHMNTTINTRAEVARANEKIRREINEQPDAYSRSLNANNLWKRFNDAMLPEITNVITFCSKLPGFLELVPDDQIVLIKQGCFEVMVTRFGMLVDLDNEEMFDPTLAMKAPRQIVQDTPMGQFLDMFFDVASKINPLELTDEEIGLFTAVLMLRPDREGLTNQSSVYTIQQLFLQSLYLLLKKNSTNYDEKFNSLMKMGPVVSGINRKHLVFLRKYKMKSQTEFDNKFPPLHKELFNITC